MSGNCINERTVFTHKDVGYGKTQMRQDRIVLTSQLMQTLMWIL